MSVVDELKLSPVQAKYEETHLCILLLPSITGGLAGSASLITGSLGRSLSLLSFDDDYKKVYFINMSLWLC